MNKASAMRRERLESVRVVTFTTIACHTLPVMCFPKVGTFVCKLTPRFLKLLAHLKIVLPVRSAHKAAWRPVAELHVLCLAQIDQQSGFA